VQAPVGWRLEAEAVSALPASGRRPAMIGIGSDVRWRLSVLRALDDHGSTVADERIKRPMEEIISHLRRIKEKLDEPPDVSCEVLCGQDHVVETLLRVPPKAGPAS
jgi:hypothetical protein